MQSRAAVAGTIVLKGAKEAWCPTGFRVVSTAVQFGVFLLACIGAIFTPFLWSTIIADGAQQAGVATEFHQMMTTLQQMAQEQANQRVHLDTLQQAIGSTAQGVGITQQVTEGVVAEVVQQVQSTMQQRQQETQEQFQQVVQIVNSLTSEDRSSPRFNSSSWWRRWRTGKSEWWSTSRPSTTVATEPNQSGATSWEPDKFGFSNAGSSCVCTHGQPDAASQSGNCLCHPTGGS